MKGMLLLLFFAFMNVPTHNLQVAFFTISKDAGQLQLDVNFERTDFMTSIANPESITSKGVYQLYLEKHLTIEINNKSYPIKISEVIQKKHHILLQCHIGTSPQKINEINIENSFLLESEGHSNIVELRLNDQERDFLMNRERTQIEVLF